MIIPGREKGIKSIRIPNFFFRAFVFLFVLFFILLGILGYDYWKIILQVYENKHLRTENRLLKEQIKLNQMKINTLTEDIKRIHTFEEKLKRAETIPIPSKFSKEVKQELINDWNAKTEVQAKGVIAMDKKEYNWMKIFANIGVFLLGILVICVVIFTFLALKDGTLHSPINLVCGNVSLSTAACPANSAVSQSCVCPSNNFTCAPQINLNCRNITG